MQMMAIQVSLVVAVLLFPGSTISAIVIYTVVGEVRSAKTGIH